jgi:hypothetical protein
MRKNEKKGHFHLVLILCNLINTLTKTSAYLRCVFFFIFLCVTKVDTLSHTALNTFIQLMVFSRIILFSSSGLRIYGKYVLGSKACKI